MCRGSSISGVDAFKALQEVAHGLPSLRIGSAPDFSLP
jgi:hypothetical protein